MKYKLNIILLILIACKTLSASADTTLIRHQQHRFYAITKKGNTSTIIFLHGGVGNPVFNDTGKVPSLHYLLEGNQDFIPWCMAKGYNLLLPIKDDSLNWLDYPAYCHRVFKSYARQHIPDTNQIILSGFSDGGSGSYKIFYTHPESYKALIVFNGYPQHRNFNKTVDYAKVKDKTVVFFSSDKDKVIPYEFLLVEYSLQKQVNPSSWFYLTKGHHTFGSYTDTTFEILFEILSEQNKCTKTEPIQAFIKNDVPLIMYPFRKSIVRKYGFGRSFYIINKAQRKRFKTK